MAVSKKPAPRAVRKAKPTDGDWIACFDRNGQLIGICPPDAITPVSDTDDGAQGAANGVTKRARHATPQPRSVGTPAARRQRAAELRKGLSGPGLAADGDRLAKAMGEAAHRVLKQIHNGQRAA